MWEKQIFLSVHFCSSWQCNIFHTLFVIWLHSFAGLSHLTRDNGKVRALTAALPQEFHFQLFSSSFTSEQNALNVLFQTSMQKLSNVCNAVNQFLKVLFPHAYKDDEEETHSDRKVKWAPNPKAARRQSTFMPLAIHRKPVGQKAIKAKALQKHSQSTGMAAVDSMSKWWKYFSTQIKQNSLGGTSYRDW